MNGVEIEIDTGKGAKGTGESQNPHPLINQTPKGCGTQEVAGALRVSHPPDFGADAGDLRNSSVPLVLILDFGFLAKSPVQRCFAYGARYEFRGCKGILPKGGLCK